MKFLILLVVFLCSCMMRTDNQRLQDAHLGLQSCSLIATGLSTGGALVVTIIPDDRSWHDDAVTGISISGIILGVIGATCQTVDQSIIIPLIDNE